jgi:membrane protein YqaA with SNARE-associated domain
MKDWKGSLQHRISETANTKLGIFILFISAMADASFLPLPITTLFLFLIFLNSKMIHKYVFFVILGTLSGATAGYLFGHFAWLKSDGEFTDAVQFLFNNIPGFTPGVYQKVHDLFTKWDFWILCAATVTPLPYGMFSVSSGVFDVGIIIFLLTTLVCQTIKFSFLAVLTMKLGPEVKRMMKFNWKPIVILAAVVLIVIAVSNIV